MDSGEGEVVARRPAVTRPYGEYGMRPFTPDPSKISANPFGFKSDSAEATAHLNDSLRELARFFDAERANDDEVHDAWNNFQARCGDPAVVHFTLSIGSVMGQEAELEAVKRCQEKHQLELTERVFVLSYLGLLESVEQASGSRASVKQALLQGLQEVDKRTLLEDFSFSEKYVLGTEAGRRRHLHCRRRESQGRHVLEYCLSYCDPPSRGEVDELFPALADHLYDMRCDYVHTAAAVLFARPDVPPPPGVIGKGTLLDGYFTSDGLLVQYAVELKMDDLLQILRRCLWNRLLDRTP